MNPLGPLLAAGDDLIGALIVLLVIAVPAIFNLMARWKEAQKEAARRMRGGARPGAAPRGPIQVGGVPAGGRPDAVKDEIAEFLRRAAQGRAGAREAAAPQPPRRPPQPPRPAFGPPAPRAPVPVELEVVEEPALGKGVVTHVQEYLDSKEIVEHVQKLGAEVDQTDERLEEHLHETFDHKLSRLGRLPDEPREPESEQPPEAAGPEMPSTAAAGFAALLADATSVRQAIILNEILRRPEDRWG
jgi:hypothetical protein